MQDFYDLIIVGAGVAGLSALLASDPKQKVALLCPGSPLEKGSSWRAQGGVAVAMGEDDSPELHARDTLMASRNMADSKAVRVLVEEGPERVASLLGAGLEIDRDSAGELAFGLEAAHSRARVIHRRDHTGKSLMAHLWERARDRQNLEFIRESVVEVLCEEQSCAGVRLENGQTLRCPRVILATGGFAGLYEASTTGREVRGQGIVLAAQVGAVVKDLEFVQFHPTALDAPGDGPLPLLTEALRGAGAKLRLADGSRFVDELLPRDEVARAIASKRGEGEKVFLDLSPVERLRERFPGAYSHLTDQSRLWLPVRPAAHYTIGGVATDLEGRTTIDGLYACGEVASVGVHGANRLASNSLLEGLVFGYRAGRAASSSLRVWRRPTESHSLSVCGQNELRTLRARFEEAVGVVRNDSGLRSFLSWLSLQKQSVETLLTERVARAALLRTESVGGHFRCDSKTNIAEATGSRGRAC